MGFEVHSPQELNRNGDVAHQRCMEVRSLAVEKKVGWSKVFQDALEVLNSNREIFLKFLQQPNSLCSQHLCDVQSVPPSIEKSCITVLRPSKAVDGADFTGTKREGNKHMEKLAQMDQVIELIRNGTQYAPLANLEVNEYPAQPTRIVVLKPSSSRRMFEQPQRNGREVDKEIPSLMSENPIRHRRDESLLSSIFSNGYIGDDSLSDMSENESEMTNLSDSEIMSPPSRHSSVDVERFDCPRSSSSCRRSPESSVCREVKKRLSQRWARIASNGRSEEQRHVTTSSCRLGDMLALNDIKVTTSEQGPGGLTSCPAPNASVPKERSKAKSMSSSFKGKVSGIFFSKNKKEKSGAYRSADDFPSAAGVTPCSPGEFTPEKPLVPPTESQDLPSPTSVFEQSFEEDNDAILDLSVNHKPQYAGQEVFHKTSLINKSPPIGSVARTLSWNDLNADAVPTLPLNQSCLSLSNENEEQDWIHAVEQLLSMTGLDFQVPFDSFITGLHSPESPMNPSLRHQYANMYDKEQPHDDEAKRRQLRSSRKLIFDSVNAAIMEITEGWSGASSMISTPSMGLQRVCTAGAFPLLVVDHFRRQMLDCFCGGGGWSTGDDRHSFSQVVWRIVKKEVVGMDWVDQIEVHNEDMGMEVQGRLLDDLLEEAVVDLMGWRL